MATLFTDGFIADLTADVNARLAAKRDRLKELQRAGRRPKVKSVREQDVVVEARKVEGKTKPEMIARFTINGIPAMAILGRRSGASDADTVWPYLHGDRVAEADRPSFGGEVAVTLAYKPGGGQRGSEADGA